MRATTLVVALAAGCSGGAASADGPIRPDSGVVVTGVGAHLLYTQDETRGTDPATSGAVTTGAQGSTLIAFAMGWNKNFAAPTDSFDNSWTAETDQNIYAGGNFYTSVWAATDAAGGAGHTLSFAKSGRPNGEISMGMIEIPGGGAAQLVYRLTPPDDPTPGSVTTNGPATLIAIWGGDAFSLSHTAQPDQGFAVIDQYLELGPSSGVQVAVAARHVTEAGTYSVTWTATPEQGCACYLIAIE